MKNIWIRIVFGNLKRYPRRRHSLKYYKEKYYNETFIWSYNPITKMNKLYLYGKWTEETNKPGDRINMYFDGEDLDNWKEISEKEAFLEIL